MVLFFISLFLTLITGFLVTSIFEQKNFIKIFIYFCLTMFALIIANIEILSLFSKISEYNILLINTIFSLIAGYIWFKKGKPLFQIKYRKFFKKLHIAVISDKYLLVLGLAFLFMCGVSLFLIAIMPVTNHDAKTYHVLRSLFWISNGNLNHFDIGDWRNLPMPINSEILYLWLLIFIKKQLWLGIFSFTGFLLSITSLYGILGKIKVSMRHKLWVILILASFPSVVVQISGTETDIIIAGLVLASMYLYWDSFKTNKLSELYFSALAYALAIGTKTPSLILILPVGLWMLWIGYINIKKEFYKPFIKFIGFGIVNFLLFASYNYILNYIDYGNIFGPIHFIAIHKNLYGIKGAFAGFIKHLFLFFDFTGFRWDDTLGTHILNLKSNILHYLNIDYIKDGVNSGKYELNHSLIEPCMGLGILGFLVYFPCWLLAIIKPVFKKNSLTKNICAFALIFLGALVIISYKLVYMTYSVRFFTTFCVISSPILIYSYSRKNNPAKFIITLFALFGLLFISTYLNDRPFSKIFPIMRQGVSVQKFRWLSYCSNYKYILLAPNRPIITNVMCGVELKIREMGKNAKILYFPNAIEPLLNIKLLDFENYNIDYALATNADNIKFQDYDFVILRDNFQYMNNTTNNLKKRHLIFKNKIDCEDITFDRPELEETYSETFCDIPDSFFHENNFILVDKIEYTSSDRIAKTYLFYMNKKNIRR